jgi:hypothetical protein
MLEGKEIFEDIDEKYSNVIKEHNLEFCLLLKI